MSRSFFTFLLFLSLLSISGYAQTDWRKGFIIKSKGDTIYGYIDYRDSKTNNNVCSFRIEENSEVQKFTPAHLLGYRFVDGKFYVSKTLTLSGNEQQLFLEFLIKGKANIYYLKGDNDQYFIEKDGQLSELKNSVVLKNVDGVEFSRENKEYIGTLNYFLQDAKIQGEIQNSKLDNQSLIKIAKHYHEKVCSNEQCVVYEKHFKPISVDYGFVFGVNHTQLYQIFDLYYPKKDFYNYGGLAFCFRNIPGLNERFSLQLEVLTDTYKYKQKTKYYFSVPILLQYKLTDKKIYPAIEFGISNYWHKNISDVFTASNIKYFHETTFLAGLSLNYKYAKEHRLFVNTRYEINPNEQSVFRIGAGLLF